jgi:hypothetical protein
MTSEAIPKLVAQEGSRSRANRFALSDLLYQTAVLLGIGQSGGHRWGSLRGYSGNFGTPS